MKDFFEKYLKKKKVAYGLFAFIILLAAISMYYEFGSNNEISENIQEVLVRKGDLRIDMVTDGRAELSEMSLYFKTGGVIKDIYFRAGDVVEKGDIIARLDSEKYELDLESAKINYKMAQAKLEKSKEQYETKVLSEKEKLDNAIIQYAPMEKVPEAFTAQEIAMKKLIVENARSSFEAAKNATADIKMEEAAVEQAFVALKKAESALSETIIKAPSAGQILSVLHKPGDNVANANTIAIMATSNEIYVITEVLEFDIADVYLGQEVIVEFDAILNKSYHGIVSGINAAPNISGSIVTYKAEVLIEDNDDRIKSGMSGIVSLIIEQEKGVLIIPNQAVKKIDGMQVVEIKDASGQIVTKEIKTGFTDGSYVEVREGLNEGDRIVMRSRS